VHNKIEDRLDWPLDALDYAYTIALGFENWGVALLRLDGEILH
jgi:hypothetical protein